MKLLLLHNNMVHNTPKKIILTLKCVLSAIKVLNPSKMNLLKFKLHLNLREQP
jgi:hypothetical protein